MPVIGMIGAHAVGKTVAADRYKARYGDGLEVYHLDLMRGVLTNEKKRELLQKCRESAQVCLIEQGARAFASWVSELHSDEPLIVVVCSEPSARIWMETRRGRALTPYWHTKRLDYECRGYLSGFVRKRPNLNAQVFTVDNRERETGLQ